MADRMRSPAYALMYASCLPLLQQVARDHGYALAVHGSLYTDLDLIAAPWTEDAADPESLIEALRQAVDGVIIQGQSPLRRPHGRLAWSIYMNEVRYGGGCPYLDVSVMPKTG